MPQLQAGKLVAPAKNNNGLPAYQRIQSGIRLRIESGHLRPGDAVASERDLAKIHQVSLMTARHALASLEREGFVERRRGIGTFAAPPKIHFNKLMSYTEQMASRTLTAGSKVLFLKIIDSEHEAAARLSLPPTSKVIKLERLRHAAGEPFALETCYLNATEFSGLPDAPLNRESLFALLERNYKVELGYADEEIDATRRRSQDRRVPRRSAPRTTAADSPAHLFNQRQSNYVRLGLLSFRPPQPRHSPVRVKWAGRVNSCVYGSPLQEAEFLSRLSLTGPGIADLIPDPM